MEMLVVIGILGILTSVAVVGIARMRHTAEVTALDQSLQALSTGTDARVVLDDLDYPAAAVAALALLRYSDSMVIDLDPVDAVSTIARVHYVDRSVPCRQVKLSSNSSGAASDCTGP